MNVSQPNAPAPFVKPETQVLWPVIGKAWKNADKKGRELLSLVFGNRAGGAEQVGTITLAAGDRLVMRPNVKRPGRKDPDYQICYIPQA